MKTYYATTADNHTKEIKADSLLQALALGKQFAREIGRDVWLTELVAVLAANDKPLSTAEALSPVIDWLSGGAK